MDDHAPDAPVSRRQFMTAVTGAAAAGAAGTAAGQEETTTTTDGNGTTATRTTGGGTPTAGQTTTGEGGDGGGTGTEGGGGGGGGGSEEVIVGPDGNTTFEPAELTIENGTTVTFVWESDNHNVVVDSQPDGANWEGHESIENEGFEFSHTFDTNGEYAYFCQPHVGVGMEGTITVQETVDTEVPANTGPVLPESAKTLGVATVTAMVSVLSLAYFFLRFGGDYETPE